MSKPERIIRAETGLQCELGYEHHIYADRCETHLVMDHRHTNRHGGLHGGIHAILLDSACGFAASRALSEDASQLVTTVSLTTNYVGLAKDDRVFAVGRVTKAGRSMVFAEGEVRDGLGTLLATGSSVLKAVRKKPS
ncbi:MAG: PaaI family thioesterase [Pseudomonadota bacterium]